MKKLLLLFSLSVLLVACGGEKEPTKETMADTEDVAKEKSPKTLEDKLNFTDFTFEIKEVKLEGDSLKLDTLYTNDSFPEEKSFMAAAMISVYQNGKELEEISGVKQDPRSNYYYKNKLGIWAPIKFEYKLINETDDVEVKVSTLDLSEEDSTTITFE